MIEPSSIDSDEQRPPSGSAAGASTRGITGLESHWNVSRPWAIAVSVLAALGVVLSVLLWQKLNSIQEELARRSLDSGAQAVEARTLARQAQDSTRELTARLASQESRISEVSLQRTQLEELMQSLSRSRDENLVVDVESALRLAQQQAQLTGSAEPLIAALKSADQRLARAAQPRLNPLQRAVVKDMERIKTATLTDVPVLLLKLDELSRLADELTLANAVTSTASTKPDSALNEANPRPAKLEATAAASVAAAQNAASGTGWGWFSMYQWVPRNWVEVATSSLRDETRKLLRVSRIDQPEAALLSPDQAFFFRENFKLRLLNARLALLSRQTETARADLQTASVWLAKYFDQNARKTQATAQLLQQVQAQLKTSELPRLDDTMAALATAAAGR